MAGKINKKNTQKDSLETSVHLVNPIFQFPIDTIKIVVFGIGGTGSLLLSNLARMNNALKSIGHMGIKVIAIDDDIVESHNVGRQMFYPPDIGRKKAEVLITRINNSYGFDWQSYSERLNEKTEVYKSFKTNLVFSCVDSIESRKFIKKFCEKSAEYSKNSAKEFKLYYWIDCGNTKDTGQVKIASYNNKTKKLFDVFHIWKGIEKNIIPDMPSCSAVDSLRKQDLFINSFVALAAANITWNIMRSDRLDYDTVFVNSDDFAMKKAMLS